MTTCLNEGALQAYLDEELATEEAGALIAHLAECSDCAQHLATAEHERLRLWNALIDELPAVVPTASLRAGIDAGIARNRASLLTSPLTWIATRLMEVTQQWRPVAAAAAAALLLSVMTWMWIRPATREQNPPSANTTGPQTSEQDHPPLVARTPEPDDNHNSLKPRRGSHVSVAPVVVASEDDALADLYEGTYFFDAETTRHLEKAQVLLRSFNNEPSADPRAVAYEKRQSRGLVYANILLRREAEAEENSPASSLLGSLEPFLLDIANLPDKPSSNELASVRQRIRNSDIVAALQVYSSRIPLVE